MRRRPSARILLLDRDERVFLLRAQHTRGALAGQAYWYVPGGALETGETYEHAAVRELQEEIGLDVAGVGKEIGRREFVLTLTDGEQVAAEEHFFAVRTDAEAISCEHWADGERAQVVDYRWWQLSDLDATTDTVFPENISEMLAVALGKNQRVGT